MSAEPELPRAVVGIDLSINATGWAMERPWILKESDFAGGVIVDRTEGIKRIISIVNRLAIQINELPQGLKPLAVISRRESKCLDTIREEAILEVHLRCWLHLHHMPTMLVPQRDLLRWLSRGKPIHSRYSNSVYIWRRFHVEVQEVLHARAVGLLFMGKAFLGEWEMETPNETQMIRKLRKQNFEAYRVCGVKS